MSTATASPATVSPEHIADMAAQADAQLERARRQSPAECEARLMEMGRRHAEQDRRDAERMMAPAQPDSRLMAVPAPATNGSALAPAGQRGRSEARPGSRSSRRSSTRSSAKSGDSGEPGESEPPQQVGRLCENKRCEADISHRPTLARYCNDACQQEAYRDRLTHEHLDELVGTAAVEVSCRCAPKGHLVIGGVCFVCGRARGAITRAWLGDEQAA